MLPKKRKFPSSCKAGNVGSVNVVSGIGAAGLEMIGGEVPSLNVVSSLGGAGLEMMGVDDVTETTEGVNLAEWRGHRVLVKIDKTLRYFPATIKDITNTPSDLIVQVCMCMR